MMSRKSTLLGVFMFIAFLTYMTPVKANFSEEVGPIADCMVREHYPNNNYGDYDYLGVGADLWGDQEATYLKFIIPSVEEKVIRVYISTYWYSFMVETPLSLSASLVLFNWSESVITWNNRPPGVQVLTTDTSVGDRDYFIIDLDLSLATEGSVISLIIIENTPYKPEGLQGNSRETGDDVPELVIEYEVPLGIITAPIIFVAVAVGIVTSVQYRRHITQKRKRLKNEKKGREFQERKGYSQFFITVNSFFFLIFLIGLIGFNAFMQDPPFAFFISPLVEFLETIAIPINLTITGLLCFFGIFFTLSWWKFFAAMRQKIKKEDKPNLFVKD